MMPKPKSTAIGDEVGIEADKTLLGLVDPEFAGDAAEDVRLQIGWSEVRVRRETHAIALAGGAGNHVLEFVEEGVGQEAEHVSHAVGVLLLTLAAMVLQFGMLGERVEAVEFGFVGVRVERLAVGGNQAGYVAFRGFDDELGCVSTLVDPVEQVLERPVIFSGVEAMLDRAADQGRGIDRCGWRILRGR